MSLKSNYSYVYIFFLSEFLWKIHWSSEKLWHRSMLVHFMWSGLEPLPLTKVAFSISYSFPCIVNVVSSSVSSCGKKKELNRWQYTLLSSRITSEKSSWGAHTSDFWESPLLFLVGLQVLDQSCWVFSFRLAKQKCSEGTFCLLLLSLDELVQIINNET